MRSRYRHLPDVLHGVQRRSRVYRAIVLDENATNTLISAYAVAVDHRDERAFAELWVEGGVLVIFQDGPEQPQNERLRRLQ